MNTTAVGMVEEANARVSHVSPVEAFEEAATGGVTFLDVREPVEWERHIAGAVQVPRGILEFSADPTSPRHLPDLNPGERVVVYCRSGHRSALATATLQTLGYSRISNLDGGLNGWQEAGLPVAEHHDGL